MASEAFKVTLQEQHKRWANVFRAAQAIHGAYGEAMNEANKGGIYADVVSEETIKSLLDTAMAKLLPQLHDTIATATPEKVG